ncbi:MAG TPA: hypothetical protein PKG52_06700 [bacterium]|nr:hypothetical protein [bacterium]HPS31584.1 hypothetical protein [bacterium]
MKISTLRKNLLFSILIFTLLSSCSEFLLIPITVDYPFDEDSPSSPSKYEIDINDGINLLEGVLTTDVSAKVIENELKTQYPAADQINVSVTNSTISTDDMIDVISGKTVKKTIAYTAKITQNGSEITKTDSKSVDITVCNFYDGSQTEDPSFSGEGIKLTIRNVVNFCTSSASDQEKTLKNCENPALTIDQLKLTCTYLETRHENTSISIMLGEVKELQDYKKYLNKIYSATLNELTFSIYEKPEIAGSASRFSLEAELFSQSIDRFKKDGSPCEDATDETCVLVGVNDAGEVENYFSDDKDIREKYLVGVFGSSDFQIGDEMKLLYTYNGKDILQTAIKHLNFQIGAKSFYLFFPQSGKPTGKLTADIKAKLFFNVEPLN